MKLRICFVSNSSCASFVCQVCGEDRFYVCDSEFADEYDTMCSCENGHVFCKDHINYPQGKSKEDIDDWEKVPLVFCPICNSGKTDVFWLINRIAIREGKTVDQVIEELRKESKDFYDA
jgi:hypothetical protein